MDKALDVQGRAMLVAGLVPALFLVALNLALAWSATDFSASMAHRLEQTLQPNGLAQILLPAVLVGMLFLALNPTLIRACEGDGPLMRRLLSRFRRANQQRYDRLAGRTLELERMRATVIARLESDGAAGLVLRRQADSIARELDAAYGQADALPRQRERVKPTRMGNAYAVLEDYPFERYGMDPMVWWPRLIGVVPPDYRQAIGEQKTTCDFLLHTAVVFALVAAEALIVGILGVTDLVARIDLVWPALVFVLPALLLAYGLYRLSVRETLALGQLIDGAFDLYRLDLLKQLGIVSAPELQPEPSTVEAPGQRVAAAAGAERDIWLALGVFIRRPAMLSEAEAPPEPRAGAGVVPDGATTAAPSTPQTAAPAPAPPGARVATE